MNVLSLFDGMSCGRIALERAGIHVDNYYAAEIDKYATQVSKKNYPDIIRLGDVTKWQEWELPKIDLILAGSPCQGFSFAGKQLAFDDPRSKLFFTFIDIAKHYCHKDLLFLLENVKMKAEYRDVISKYMGCEPIEINSALVSAQNRRRLYWTNIPVEQPEDRGLLLENILECGSNTINQRGRRDNLGGLKTGKAPCITSSRWEENHKVPVIKSHGELIYKPHKSQCLDANYFKGPDNHGQRTGCIEVGHAELSGHDVLKRVYSPKGKSPTLTAICGGNQERKIAVDARHWRKLSPVECERLQTVPDNYTEGVSNTQRYKMLGNGWTIEVIAHILSGINKKEAIPPDRIASV